MSGMWNLLWRPWVLSVCLCLASMGMAQAGYYVYTSGVTSPPAPGANQYTVDFNTRTLATEVTASRVTSFPSTIGSSFLRSSGTVSYTATLSATGFAGNVMRVRSGTSENPTSVKINFTNPTPYIGFMWNTQFNAENTQFVNLTLQGGSVVTLKNCTSTSNAQCVGMYVDNPSWLSSLLGALLGWLLGDSVSYHSVYTQYTPADGLKITAAEFKVYNCANCGFLSSDTSQDMTIDNISYVDGSAAPHHLEVTADSSSASANVAKTFTIKACGNADCSVKYITGVTGTLAVAGVGATFSPSANFTIPAGPTNTTTVSVTFTSAGTAAMSLSAYSPTPSNTPKVFCGMGTGAISGGSCNVAVTAPLHHVRISASNGLTCTPLTYTLRACSDATCTSEYTQGLTGNLSVTGSGMTVNYPSGAAFTITAGQASTTVPVHVTTVGSVTTATLNTLSATPTGSPSVYCGMNGATPTSGGSCTVSAASSGLLFNVLNHASETAQSVTVSAVNSSNAAVCTPAFASVARNVNFKCSYTNPTTVSPTAPKPVRVADATTNVYHALNAGNSTSAACDGSGRSVALNFNASGVATAKFMYADVGQMGLTATYTGGAGTNDTGLTMTGSDSFIAAPASFSVSGLTAVPIKAGESFSATVTALNSAGAVATNFGRETAAETVRLTHTKYRPSGGVAGSFTGTGVSPAAALGGFSAGAATASNLQWTEVGLLDLTATLTSASYLGSGLSASGTTGSTGAVGPITPHHFDVAVTQGCGASFTYSGQPFGVTVTARNAANATTQNYAGSGTVVAAPLLSVYPQGVSLSAVNNAGTGALTSGTVSATSFVAGEATVSATPVFTFTNKQTVPTSVSIRATDGLYSAVTSTGYNEGSVALRSGRLKMSNAFGSEKRSLALPVQAQYWSSTKAWVVNGADSCTTVPAAAVATSNHRNSLGVAAAGWSTSGSAITLSSGNGTLTMSAPSPATAGSVEVALNLGATTADNACLGTHPASTGANLGWLRGLNGNCAATHDRDPSARINFGIYSPESRKTVHIRELY